VAQSEVAPAENVSNPPFVQGATACCTAEMVRWCQFHKAAKVRFLFHLSERDWRRSV
jgi:hypothetical protein